METIIFQNADGAQMTFNNPRLLTFDVIKTLHEQGYKLISGNL